MRSSRFDSESRWGKQIRHSATRSKSAPYELHKLVTHHVMGFVLYPVAHIVEFEPSYETRKAGTHFVYGKRIEFFHSIRLPPDEERRLGDLRALESGRQIEIRFGGAVVVQAAVKPGAPEFGDVVIDVIRFRP